MSRIRVLIVDDSVVARRMVGDALAADPAIEVAAIAASGAIALAKLSQQGLPDAVILDVEMPDMDGLETLTRIRERYPRLPVIMFSAQTERGAAATLDALLAGASDYATKPARSGSSAETLQRIRADLAPKLKTLCPHRVAVGPCASSGVLPRITRNTRETEPLGIVAIGASTGGPGALSEILPHLAGAATVPIVIVQHMPPLFTHTFAQRLARDSGLDVREGESGQALEPGAVWLAPGGSHMDILRDGPVNRLRIHDGPPENSCRPAVDVLFRSVAAAYGASALALVLTGMGHDGLQGSQAIRDAHGRVWIQDEASSVVWGMPGHVARGQLADRELELSQIGVELRRELLIAAPVSRCHS